MIGQTAKNNALIRQVFFMLTLITIALIIVTKLSFFISSFLGAITIYVVLRNVLFYLTDTKRWKKWKASLVIVFGMTVLLLGIGFLFYEVVASEMPTVDTSKILTQARGLVSQISGRFGLTSFSDKIMGESSGFIGGLASSFLNTTYSFVVNIMMMIIILFFMMANARSMEAKILEYQPFKGENLDMIKSELRKMIFSNAVVIPVVMFGQGVVAWLIYWILGVDNAIFWGFLTAFCGLIPMVGTVIVSAPLGIYLIMGGDVWQGITLIACGVVIIANVDNLIRIIIVNKSTDTHPLVLIFGMILGIPLFGFWGIIFGPLLISGFLLLVKIYYKEYGLNKPVNKSRCDG